MRSDSRIVYQNHARNFCIIIDCIIINCAIAGIAEQEVVLCRETEAALDLWTDLRSNASTPSTFVTPQLMPSFPSNLRKRARDVEPASRAGAAAAAPAAVVAGAHGPAGDAPAAAGDVSARQELRDNSSRVGTASKSGSGSGSPAAAAAPVQAQQQAPAGAGSGSQARQHAPNCAPGQASPRSVAAR